ncbi:hypothetical protein RJ55_05999 [Drechmeria coniospora]|nr:hypothetical protein RJ55_05999 [Drechmeria coniospora]
MTYEPEEFSPATPPFFEDGAGDVWVPLYRHSCTFGPDVFVEKMDNMIRNPNLNSSWLFRADILHDDLEGVVSASPDLRPVVRDVKGMRCHRRLVRKLIPRNDRRDAPLDQTCSFHHEDSSDETLRSLVLYLPHASSGPELPFYHPHVRGIAHLHEWDPVRQSGSISIHFLPFEPDHLDDPKTRRPAYHLLHILHKHGHGVGYVKKVHHDIVVPQATFQDRYMQLKNKYARDLVQGWAESTDPAKHVFEDLAIASFLIGLWEDMFKGGSKFPGFVDIGCGNGLLVHVLNKEGYAGWGFDARARKSWAQYQSPVQCSPSGQSLEQRLLLPSVVPTQSDSASPELDGDLVHDGVFPQGTFIISNHADELTPWTPILAALSRCPFLMIPCCSHRLTGEKFRAPAPRDKSKSSSTFASLVDWVTRIGEDCGWLIEVEMMRIPSTRNIGLLGRTRVKDAIDIDVDAILRKYGGVDGYYDNVAKLVKAGPRSH